MAVATVTLEILRHGASHAQILSPVNRYLALCGDHDGATVQVPVDHWELLAQLGALASQEPSPEREALRQRAAQTVREVLEAVPSLAAELRIAEGPGTSTIHVSLVLSAAELALLPFEIAAPPRGYADGPLPLALRDSPRVVLTRTTRRARPPQDPWPQRPRVLVVAASPEGVPGIPLRAHLLALRQALDPWIGPPRPGEPDPRDALLTVLPRATWGQVREACGAAHFTHVHVLAHGAPREVLGQRKFGIALHGEAGAPPLDVVDGARLARALRSFRRAEDGQVLGPTVVTLATCDSANVGSVVAPGASVAHDLHHEGIPLVLASQFPLTWRGSVVLTQTLYPGLLRGEDVCRTIHGARVTLQGALGPDSADWASLAAYAALPEDLDEQLVGCRLRQADRASNTASDWIDALAAGGFAPGSPEALAAALELERHFARLRAEIERLEGVEKECARRAERSLPSDADHYRPWEKSRTEMWKAMRAEALGCLGSASKRVAEGVFAAGRLRGAPGEEPRRPGGEERRALVRARGWYRQAAGAAWWQITQCLCLDAVLDGTVPRERWRAAREAAGRDLGGSASQAEWAEGTLTELHLLEALAARRGLEEWGDTDALGAADRARKHARALLAHSGPDGFPARSTRRQIRRYVAWWSHLGVADLAADLVAVLEGAPVAERVGGPPP